MPRKLFAQALKYFFRLECFERESVNTSFVVTNCILESTMPSVKDRSTLVESGNWVSSSSLICKIGSFHPIFSFPKLSWKTPNCVNCKTKIQEKFEHFSNICSLAPSLCAGSALRPLNLFSPKISSFWQFCFFLLYFHFNLKIS